MAISQVPIWFKRKFEFSFPVELLPNLRARLRGTPARLEEALRGRSPKVLISKAQEKWSAQEHAGHLRLRDGQRPTHRSRLEEPPGAVNPRDMLQSVCPDREIPGLDG